MGLQYKRVLVLGATSGIGKALAERFIRNGAFVILTGRRKERLDELVDTHGKDKAAGIQFDIGDLDAMPGFIQKVTGTYPDIDLVFLNAGIQRAFRFDQPASVDMDVVQEELHTNYTAPVAFTKRILPFLLARKETPATILYTTSNLGIVPLARAPNYSGSKAAMHAMILCLRLQLQGTNVKIQELLPPAVQTELHDQEHQPDIKNGRSFGMPLDAFTDRAYASIVAGKETIFVNSMEMGPVEETELKRQELFGKLNGKRE